MAQLLASTSAVGEKMGLLHVLSVGQESSQCQLDHLLPVSFVTCNNEGINNVTWYVRTNSTLTKNIICNFQKHTATFQVLCFDNLRLISKRDNLTKKEHIEKGGVSVNSIRGLQLFIVAVLSASDATSMWTGFTATTRELFAKFRRAACGTNVKHVKRAEKIDNTAHANVHLTAHNLQMPSSTDSDKESSSASEAEPTEHQQLDAEFDTDPQQ